MVLVINAAGLALEARHLVFAGFDLLLCVVASGHVVLYKRDSRAAIAWVGFVWLVPFAGAILYFLFGVNRIRRKAILLRADVERFRAHGSMPECLPDELHRHLPGHTGHMHVLAKLMAQISEQPLVPGNRIEPLVNGDEAYPAMLEAIRRAEKTISLETYIFDRDEAGLEFAVALGEAVRRGVEVRVLVDAAGTRYSWPTITRVLHREKLRCALFHPAFGLSRLMSVNLRTHRKILVLDGRAGFTGGLNIRVGHQLKRHPRSPVQDVHFRVEGPAVTQLQEAFAEDWAFATGESLRGEEWFPKVANAGGVIARGIADGPDEDFEKLRWALLGALTTARHAVRIVTPYFVPDTTLISALNLAAMRGVEIDIILPERVNLPFVGWASRAMWWQVLSHGCRIWLTPPPFDHSKLMIVDGCWSLVGSANWDARSLRLNFEYNVECYDVALAARLEECVGMKRRKARRVTLEEMDARPLPWKLRDGVARLLTPYL